MRTITRLGAIGGILALAFGCGAFACGSDGAAQREPGHTDLDPGVATPDAGGTPRDGAPSDQGRDASPPSADGGSVGPLVFDGFFPIGVWVQPDSTFQTWKERGVNTLIEVPEGWDAVEWSAKARAAGLRYVRAPLDDPKADIGDTSLLAWNQDDEPDGINQQIPYSKVQETYKSWKAIDPSRPVLLNLIGAMNQYDLKTDESGPSWYAKYAEGADLVSGDTYPVNSGDPLSDVGEMVDNLRALSNGKKPVFAFIESADIDSTDGTRPPSPGEFRAQIWDAVIHGVRGIWYFPVKVGGGFEWDVTPDDIAAEMTRQDALISGLASTLQGAIEPSSVSVTVSAPLKATWRRDATGTYAIVLNFSDKAEASQSIAITGAGPSSTATVVGENRNVAVAGGTIVDSFEPYAVHIYRIE